MKDFFVKLHDLVEINSNRNWRGQENDSCIVIVLFICPEADTEDDEEVKRPKDLPAKENENVGSFDNHGSWSIALSYLLCSLDVETFVWIFENIGDPFSILKIHCINGPVQDDVLHVPVDEPNGLNWFIFAWIVLLVRPLNNCVLIVVVQNEEMSSIL